MFTYRETKNPKLEIPLLHYKYFKNVCKIYKGKINYKKAQGHNNNYSVFENCFLKNANFKNFTRQR
jgi:hypothetical protein